jgi:hypothetical protein
MKTRTARIATLLLALVGCLAFVQGWAQVPSQITQINVLMIHGRSNSGGEKFGWFRTDQHQAWGGLKPVTQGNVWYVQWDAWNRHFDDTTCPGGECIIKNAANALCNSLKGQECWIICHSVGCAAFENYLSKSNYATNSLLIAHVIAADSAAGGSELADNGVLRLIGGLTGQSGAIDVSLKTSYARGAYNHNNMQGVVVRGVGGATDSYPGHVLIACNFFPRQGGSGLNSQCTGCGLITTTSRECSDGAVALHSTCGHNRKASFQNCNSTLAPHTDTAGTFHFHGWWVTDHECSPAFSGSVGTGCNWSGPYSSTGKSRWNSGFKTYHNDHSDGKQTAVDEYSSAPALLCP